MKQSTVIFLCLVPLVILGNTSIAHAQFNPLQLAMQTETEMEPSGSGAPIGTRRPAKLQQSYLFYPYANFQFGVGENDRANLKNYQGVLFAPEVIFPSAGGRQGIGVGGWLWKRTGSYDDDRTDPRESQRSLNTVGDLHLKYLVNRSFAVQAGYLWTDAKFDYTEGTSTIPTQRGVNLYLIYGIGSKSVPRKNNYSVSFGAGLQNSQGGSSTFRIPLSAQSFVDNSYDFKTATYFSGFVTGSYQLKNRFTLNASYWFLAGKQKFDLSQREVVSGVEQRRRSDNDIDVRMSRFAVGFGYSL